MLQKQPRLARFFTKLAASHKAALKVPMSRRPNGEDALYVAPCDGQARCSGALG